MSRFLKYTTEDINTAKGTVSTESATDTTIDTKNKGVQYSNESFGSLAILIVIRTAISVVTSYLVSGMIFWLFQRISDMYKEHINLDKEAENEVRNYKSNVSNESFKDKPTLSQEGWLGDMFKKMRRIFLRREDLIRIEAKEAIKAKEELVERFNNLSQTKIKTNLNPETAKRGYEYHEVANVLVSNGKLLTDEKEIKSFIDYNLKVVESLTNYDTYIKNVRGHFNKYRYDKINKNELLDLIRDEARVVDKIFTETMSVNDIKDYDESLRTVLLSAENVVIKATKPLFGDARFILVTGKLLGEEKKEILTIVPEAKFNSKSNVRIDFCSTGSDIVSGKIASALKTSLRFEKGLDQLCDEIIESTRTLEKVTLNDEVADFNYVDLEGFYQTVYKPWSQINVHLLFGLQMIEEWISRSNVELSRAYE